MKKSPNPSKGAGAGGKPATGKNAKKASPTRSPAQAQSQAQAQGTPTKSVVKSAQSADDDKKPLFFFKPNEPHGEFCQWFPATFTVDKADMSALVGHPIDQVDPEGWSPIYFHCAEQYMMYCKGGCFSDTETQRRIMATDDAKEQKRLGRQTAGFDAAIWDPIKSDVVVLGNLAKFGQNQALRTLLLATGERVLAEAAKEDRVWGIGFTAQEASLQKDQSRWGENRLGKALMEVRRRLTEERGRETE